MNDGVVMLAPFVLSDAPALCAVDHDPEHRRRFEFPEDFRPSVHHSKKVIRSWLQDSADGTRYAFAVRHATTIELLGGCELRFRESVGKLSYWTLPERRGRGFASRGVALTCRFAFDELGLDRLEIEADLDNMASRRVAVRSGFTQQSAEGRVRYVLHASEFASR